MKIKNFLRNQTPTMLVLMGFLIPAGVFYHRSLQLKRMEDGVRKDLERIKSKGKKFSDIPKSS
jgi:hypothetical protein